MLTRWIPAKIARLASVGALLSTSRLLAPLIILALIKLRDHVFRLQAGHLSIDFYDAACVILILCPAVIGSQVLARAKRQFDTALDKKLWTDGETAIAKRWIESPSLERRQSFLYWTLGICWLLTYARWHSTASAGFTSNLVMLWNLALGGPGQTFRLMRKRFEPEPPERVPPKGGAGTIQGIYSEHWGGREMSKSGRSEA
jgi:hypothetical protein